MFSNRPQHSIALTPALAVALDQLRARLGKNAPSLDELALRGAEDTLLELDAKDGPDTPALVSFVDRLVDSPQPDLAEARRIRFETPVIRTPEGSPPITPEMVRRALDED